MKRQIVLVSLILLIASLVSIPALLACPFCGAPSLTLSEQVAASQAVIQVKWIGGKEADRDSGFGGTTDFEVTDVMKDESGKVKVGDKLTVERYREAQPGDLFLLLGTVIEDRIEWSSPMEITETSYRYIVEAPTKDSPEIERLAYYLQFLEHSDSLIATDAYSEFANAPYEHVVPLAGQMDRDKLRAWLSNPEITPTRIGLYGMMLGLCGEPEDAEFLKNKILEETADYRLGIDGVMGGYLLLTKADGLKVIEDSKIKNPDAPFSETFAAMSALRFMWQYSPGTISEENLRSAMRLLLDRPSLTDLVVVDLARWKDWSVMDRLMSMYTQEEYNVPSIKRAIVRYLLIAEKDEPAVEEGSHVKRAKAYLQQLREADPDTVAKAERYFFD